MTNSEVNEIFDGFNNLNCLIIGDVMVDAYIWGNVNRISPEAPVPVFEAKKRENRLGGAANVALNIQALGATPILCGIIGNDVKGKVFNEVLENQHLSTEGIIQSDERLTTCKTRIISSSHHMLRVDEEVLEPISELDSKDLINRVKNIISTKKIDVVIFEDYDKGLLNANNIQAIVHLLNEQKIPSCVDPKKDNFQNYQGTTLFKPNFKEFTSGLKEDIKKGDIKSLMEHAEKFSESNNIENVMVTLSEHGVMLYNPKIQSHIPAEIRNISDVSGAGDTVISTAALAFSQGVRGKELVTLSNLAGGLVCEEVGVVPINKERLKKEFLKRT
ncbi:MAG: PfkB family carbohydrate kinase [Flavobacteriales bacterium]|nr:PfkB family carbohydrate kinase [Flavobacteriales bacterium]